MLLEPTCILTLIFPHGTALNFLPKCPPHPPGTEDKLKCERVNTLN